LALSGFGGQQLSLLIPDVPRRFIHCAIEFSHQR
jgi:hypothetical protein